MPVLKRALDRMEALLLELHRRNVPFDGIGVQAHEPRGFPFPLDRLWDSLSRLGQYGRVHITELSIPTGPPDRLPSDWGRVLRRPATKRLRVALPYGLRA